MMASQTHCYLYAQALVGWLACICLHTAPPARLLAQAAVAAVEGGVEHQTPEAEMAVLVAVAAAVGPAG